MNISATSLLVVKKEIGEELAESKTVSKKRKICQTKAPKSKRKPILHASNSKTTTTFPLPEKPRTMKKRLTSTQSKDSFVFLEIKSTDQKATEEKPTEKLKLIAIAALIGIFI